MLILVTFLPQGIISFWRCHTNTVIVWFWFWLPCCSVVVRPLYRPECCATTWWGQFKGQGESACECARHLQRVQCLSDREAERRGRGCADGHRADCTEWGQAGRTGRRHWPAKKKFSHVITNESNSSFVAIPLLIILPSSCCSNTVWLSFFCGKWLYTQAQH